MDTLRGGAVVAVLVMHAELGVVQQTGADLPLVHAVNDALGDVRMPMLVFLSGVLLPRSLGKGLRSHLRGKVVHILWPYAVWGLLDCTHAVVRAWVTGAPVPWQLYGQLLYDPHTYLWFLAYLFVFHVAAGFLPGWARVAGVPLALVGAQAFAATGSLHKLLWLFGFFLLGDVAARALAGRVPAGLSSRVAPLGWEPLAAVGRQSIVFYASHLLVLIQVTDLLHAAGLTHAPSLWLASCTVTLAVGVLLVRLRTRPWVGWLFMFPARQRDLSHSARGQKVVRSALP